MSAFQTSVEWHPQKGMEGQVLLNCHSAPVILSMLSDEAGGIPYGRAVMLKSGASEEVDLPADALEAAAAWGLAIRNPTKEADVNGAGVYADGEGVPVMVEGVAYVRVEDAVVYGATPFVRFEAGALLTELGRFRSDDGTEDEDPLAAERTGWMFLGNGGAGEYVPLLVQKAVS